MSELWPIRKLSELSDISYGYTEKAAIKPIGPKFLRITDIQNGSVDWSAVPYCKVDKDEHARHRLKNGDIVFARTGATTGKSYLISSPPDAVCASYLIRLRLRSTEMLPKYVSYYFGTKIYWDAISSGISGSAQGGFNASKLGELRIPVPSIAEQQRIVVILDEAFAGLATATANVEKNLKNARELFESYLLSVFAENSKTWKTTSLGNLSALFVDSAHRTPKYQTDGIPALRPRDVVNGKLSLSEAAKVSEQEYAVQSKRHRPGPGDIVYSRELSFGWAALLPDTPRVCLSQGMCLFRAGPEIDSSFLLYVLNGPIGRKQAMRAAVGTAHPHINLGDIKGYQIPTPSLREQRKALAGFDALLDHSQQLADGYLKKLRKLSDLKQSILQKAFSGELTSPPSLGIREAAE